MEETKLEGKEVKLGKRIFVVPEASLEVAEQVLPALELFGQVKNDAAAFDSVANVVRLCLVENYPGLDVKAVKKLLPFRTSIDLMHQVLEAAGFQRGATGGAPAGETGSP